MTSIFERDLAELANSHPLEFAPLPKDRIDCIMKTGRLITSETKTRILNQNKGE